MCPWTRLPPWSVTLSPGKKSRPRTASRRRRVAMRNKIAPVLLGLAAFSALFAAPRTAFAKDDFGRIVQHIETQYHVHRQHRWVMGLAGFTVRFYHFSGVKQFKAAIFENQRFLNSGSDTKFDEIVRAALDSGWQPVVQS